MPFAIPTYAVWAAMHGKVYNGDEAATRAEAIYNDNAKFIEDNNADDTLGPSPFMDLTREEFATMQTLKPH